MSKKNHQDADKYEDDVKLLFSSLRRSAVQWRLDELCRHDKEASWWRTLTPARLQHIQIGQILTTASNPEDDFTLGHRNIAPKNDFEAV
jgi:hypothetical protein